MSAAHSYISSALLAFSTYVGGVHAAEADKRAATQLFQTLLTWKTDYSVWEPQEVDQYIAETGFSTQNSEATKLLKDFIQRFPPFQVSVYLQRYLLALSEDGCSPATIRNYRSDINQFWQFAKKTELEQIFTKPVVKNFVRYEKQKGLKVSSIRRKLASISQFGLWASRQDLITGVSWLNDPNLLEKVEEDLVISGQGLIIPLVKPPVISPQPGETKPTQPPLPQVSSRDAARPTARRLQEHRAQIKAQMDLLTSRVKNQTRALVAPYVTLAMVILFFLGIGIFGYQQFIVNTLNPLAYPSTPTPPNRVLSFQGRLTDTAQNPLTTPTDMEFWLYDSGPSIVGGTILWNSGTCSVTPDQDGIFTVGLGDDCGSAITEDVFSENVNVWLQVGVEGETLSPRQPIRTVPYALNSETLQGYPINASGAATVNTVLTMDGGGSVVLGEVNPEIRSVSGTFAIQGQTLLFQTNPGSNGNIIFDADGLGGVISRDYIYAPGATLSATYAGGTALVARGGPSGTANIQEWQNAAGSALASVTSAGRFLGDSFSAGNTSSGYALSGSQTLTSSGTTYILGAHGSWTDVNIRTGGSNRLSINSSGDVTIPDLNTAGGIIYAESGGTLNVSAAGNTGECLLSGGTGAPTFGSCADAVASQILWQQVLGTAQLKNTTLDMLVGGTSTASAKFAVLNVNSGTPTASISGSSTGNALFMTGDGTISTTLNRSLLLNPTGGNVGIGTATPLAKLDLVSTSTNSDVQRWMASDGSRLGRFTETSGGAGWFEVDNASGVAQWLLRADSGVSYMASGTFGLGTTTPTALLDVNGNASSSGTLSFRGTIDPKINILNAENFGIQTSPGGDAGLVEQFTVLNNGNVGVGVTSPQVRLQVGGGVLGFSSGGNTGIVENTGVPTIYGSTNLITSGNGNLALQARAGFGIGLITGPSGSMAIRQTILPNGNIGVGTTSPIGKFVVSGTPGQSGNALAIFNNTDSGDILAASASGTTRMRLSNAGGLYLSALNTAGGIVYTDATGQLLTSTAGTIGECLVSGGTGAPTWGTCGSGGNSYWRENLGALSPINDTYDILFGADATDSAKFAFLNMTAARGNQVASVSGHLVLDSAGTIQTTNNQTLTIGGDSTGDITFSPGNTTNALTLLSDGNVGVGTATPLSLFAVGANSNFQVGSTGNVIISNTSPTIQYNDTSGGEDGFIMFADAGLFSFQNLTTGQNGFTFASYGITLGDNTDTKTLNIGGVSNSAADTINISTNGTLADVITIGNTNSSTTLDLVGGDDWSIDGTGLITSALLNTPGGILYAGTGGTVNVSSAGSVGECLLSGGTSTPTWSACPNQNYWRINQGALSPVNDTLDLLVGSNATASAKFGVLNVNGTGPATATVSGSLIVMPRDGAGGRVGIGITSPTTYLDVNPGTATQNSTVANFFGRAVARYLQATVNGTNELVGDYLNHTSGSSFGIYNAVSLGDIKFDTNNGGQGTRMILKGNGDVGIGTTSPISKFQLTGAPGVPGNALAIFNNTTATDIFTASASGTTRFTIGSNGSTSIFSDSSGSLNVRTANAITPVLRTNGSDLSVAIGTDTTNQHKLVVNGGLGANSLVNFNETNGSDIFTASASGTNRLRLANNGNFFLPTLNTAGGIVYTSSAGQLLTSAAGTLGDCLISGGAGSPTWGSCAASAGQLWRLNAGAISPINDTLDVLIGANATTSAKFAFLNVNSGTPTASISGSTTGAATYITGDGTIARTLNQDLYLNPTAGRVGIGTTSPTTTLQVNGNVQIRANSGIMFSLSDTSGNVGWRAEGTNRLGVVNAVTGFIERGDIGSSIRVRTRGGNALAQTSGTEVLFAVGNTFNPTSGTAVYNNALFDPTINQTGGANGITRGIYINPTLTAAADWRSLELANTSGYGIYQGGIGAINYLNGRLGLGTANPVAPLHVDAGYGANAATIINQLNGGDILVASASGTTRLQLANNGTLTLSAYTNNGGVLYTNGSGTIAQTVTGAAGECLHGGATPTWATCEGLGSNWRITNGAISPDNDTLDLLVGSNATASAKFAFINVDSGTPTASISANTADNNTYLSGNGILGTTNRQTLALGGVDTGDITLNPGGVTSVSLHQNNTLTLAGYTTAGGVLYTNGSGLLSQTSAGTAGQCLQGGASPTWSSCEGLGSNWRITNGAISPDNDTLDLLIGSNATASAKFAVLNVNGTGPATATVSGNLTVMPRNGAGGYVGIGTIAPTSNLDVRQLADGIDTVSIRRFTNSSPTGTLLRFNDASGSLMTFFGTFGEYHGQAITEAFDSYFDGGNWYFRGSGSAPTRIGSNNNTNIELYPQGTGNVSVRSGQLLLGNGSNSAPAMSFMSDTNTGIFGTGSDVLGFSTNGAERMRINNIGRIGIGTTTIVGGVNIDLNSGMNAGLIVNELGGGDLLTASASGTTRFRVDTNGYVHAQRFSDLADPTFFLDSAATGDSLSIAGDIRLGGGGVQNIYTTTDVGINIDPTNGTGCTTTCPVSIANGVGKIDAGAFDPPYWIQGVGYSTYAPSMVGIKEELSQVVTLQPSSVPGLYKYVIDFPSLNRTRDLDLWLFSQVSDFGPEMRDLAVLLSATGDARVNYKKDPATKQLIIYSDKPVEVSMRLTSPRFDYDKWGTIRDLQDGKGLRPTGQNFAVTGAGSSDQDLANALAQAQTWTVSSLGSLNINGSEPGSISVTKADGSSIQTAQAYLAAVIGQIRAGFIQTQQLVADRVTTNRLRSNESIQTPRVETDLISPIAGDDLTIGLKSGSDSQLRVVNQQQQVVATVDATGNAAFAGNVRAASISANRADITSARLQTIESRMAELEHVRAQTADIVNATISGTLYADDIYAFQDKVAAALEQPSLLSQLLDQIPTSSSSANPSDIFQVIDVDPTVASGAGSLNKTLADLNLSSEDVVLGGSAAFINQYFEVNGSGYIAQSLGIGDSLLVGSGTRLADGELEYISPINPESSVLKLQPSGLGTIDFLAGAMTLTQDGRVTINGNLKVAGSVETPTLLTDIIKSTDFANPLQVQVAGVSTESGEVHKSRFEIINELGTPVATISADGRADFAAGIGVGSQDLGESQDAETNKTSGRATITAETFDVTIRTRQIGPNSLVYVTPVGSTGNQVLYVKSQTADNPETGDNEGRFVVGFDETTTQNVQFNWWIVN